MLPQSVQTPLLKTRLSPSRVKDSTVRDRPSRKQRNAMSNSRMNDPERTGDYHPGGNDEPAVPAAQPQHVGRYRVERVLGQGGFGLVYLAHDDQLQRLVAIKVPHRTLVDRPEAEGRLVAPPFGRRHPRLPRSDRRGNRSPAIERTAEKVSRP